MDATHIHLVLTHFPIVGTIIGTGILAYGLFSNNDSAKKIALVTIILMAIITIPVFLTGEGAEETVEHISGVSEAMIEEHEELAEKAIWLMGLLATLSIIGFYAIAKKKSFAKTITILTLVVSLVTCGLFVIVGNHGGQIRHSEIRANNTDFADEHNEGASRSSEEEHDDEHDDDDDD